MAYSNTVLSQLLKLVPRHEIERLANQHDAKRRSDALSRWSQFVALLTGHLASRRSLRDIEAMLHTQSHQQYHLGTQSVSRSALGRANEQLDYDLFTSLFASLYQRCTQQQPQHGFRFKNKLFSLDGSLIDLSMRIFPWADFNGMKAAFKLHVGLDHDGLIPAFVSVTEGKAGEINEADQWDFPKGSVLVFDKGYGRYAWHKSLTDRGLFWVTRIRGNALYRVIERRDVSQYNHVTSDQTIIYTAKKAQEYELYPVRRVGYTDPVTGKHYVFITNQFDWSAQTIADIYKQRWQVELFFKWIKQNLKIKTFLGHSKNAVMTQIMVALCAYLLLSYLKFQSKLTKSLQEILQLLQINLFMRRPLLELLQPIVKPPPDRCQLAFSLSRDYVGQ
jgi:putative transposase